MILLLITIAYKTVLVMIGALLLLFRPRRLMHLLRPALFWVKLGMLLNVALCELHGRAGILSSLYQKLVLRMMEWFSPLFPRERWNAMKGKAAAYMDEYREASAYIKKEQTNHRACFLITFAQRCLLFAVTYLVFVSFRCPRHRHGGKRSPCRARSPWLRICCRCRAVWESASICLKKNFYARMRRETHHANHGRVQRPELLCPASSARCLRQSHIW